MEILNLCIQSTDTQLDVIFCKMISFVFFILFQETLWCEGMLRFTKLSIYENRESEQSLKIYTTTHKIDDNFKVARTTADRLQHEYS